jgi:hypothetical protein
MACPHVAGAAALIYEQMPQATVAEATAKLLNTATPNKITNADGNLQGSPTDLLNVGFTFGPTPPPTAPPPTAAPTPAPAIAPSDCSFESGTCFWLQAKSDKFDWTPGSGGTPSSSTGPSQASDGNKYMFIETSAPRSRGDTAILISPSMALASDLELAFDYHMYGRTIDELRVLVNSNSEWKLSGDQGNAWKTAIIDLSAYTGNDVIIEFAGKRGTSYTGDIAIDNVRFSPLGSTPTPAPTPPVIPLTIGSSGSNKKCVSDPGVVCPSDAGDPGKRLNTDYSNAGDTFDITSAAGSICAKRTDMPRNGWGMKLKIGCHLAPAPEPEPEPEPNPQPTVPMPMPIPPPTVPMPMPIPPPTVPMPMPIPPPTVPVVMPGPPGPPGPAGPPGPVQPGPPGPPGPPR